MNNGQGSGDTETGSYTLLGGTATPSNGTIATRTVGSAISITSENEWYKAAYYDAPSASYFDYPARSNAPTTCSAPSPFPNRANCGRSDLTAVGSYTGSASPYGTYDQGGNLWEWNESIYAFLTVRGMRGGSYEVNPPTLAAEDSAGKRAARGQYYLGFRLVMIPEPSTGLLVIAGLLGIAGWRRRTHSASATNQHREPGDRRPERTQGGDQGGVVLIGLPAGHGRRPRPASR
jgi:hypothetical protein